MSTTVTRNESTITPKRGQPITTIRWEWPDGFHEYSFHPGNNDRADNAASDATSLQEARLARRIGGTIKIQCFVDGERIAAGDRLYIID